MTETLLSRGFHAGPIEVIEEYQCDLFELPVLKIPVGRQVVLFASIR